ncbi:MAG: cytochrome c oxidase subunit II [Anaerolineae bacterium]
MLTFRGTRQTRRKKFTGHMIVKLRGAVLLAATLLSVVVGGCGLDSPMTTVLPKSDLGHLIHDLFMNIAIWAVVIFVIVEGLLIFAVWRFRDRPGRGEPRAVHGHLGLEIGWTLVPVLIVMAIAAPTISVIFRTQAESTDDALEVAVIGRQWWWEFRYPELGITTANELHVPVGRPIRLSLTSTDIIHSFWVPQLGGKRDLIPGRENALTFNVQVPGEYVGQCAEFCGISHANMRLLVVAERAEEFEAWAERMAAPPAEPTDEAARGRQAFLASGCVACHTIQGVSQSVVGPDLTHFGSRKTLASGLLPNSPEHLARWIANPKAVKPGALMPKLPLTEEQISALVAYLGSLK